MLRVRSFIYLAWVCLLIPVITAVLDSRYILKKNKGDNSKKAKATRRMERKNIFILVLYGIVVSIIAICLLHVIYIQEDSMDKQILRFLISIMSFLFGVTIHDTIQYIRGWKLLLEDFKTTANHEDSLYSLRPRSQEEYDYVRKRVRKSIIEVLIGDIVVFLVIVILFIFYFTI